MLGIDLPDSRASCLQHWLPLSPLPRPPAAACFNLAYYPATESTQCMCTAAGAQGTADLAQAASDTAVWALAGAAALCAGAIIGAVELGADAAVLRADQQFLTVAKRRSSRCAAGGSRCRPASWDSAG